MRVGLLGGSFDPVHFGHLLLAEMCREQCHLDRVWFVPAATAPHKQETRGTPGEKRVEMLRLAIGGHEALDVCELELQRGGVSYTVDTLRQLTTENPATQWYLLLGADSLVDLPTWREPAEICRLSTPVIVQRYGSPEPDLKGLSRLVTPQRLAEIEKEHVEMPRIELSSRDIRRRAAEGRSIRYMTPRAVEKYIEVEGLYRGGAPTDPV